MSPRIKDTAVALLWVYIGLTITETSLLLGFGMDFFVALCHGFSTMATGGFSPKNASVAHFDSLGIRVTVMVFMVIA